MAFENMDQAAEALAAAVSAPDSADQSQYAAEAASGTPTFANPPVVEPTTTTQGDQGDQGTQVAPEEFTPSKDIDLSGLNDEQREFIEAREREMQAAFTRKTQELSQSRQEAEQAIQFVNELNTNPYFAQQVVGELSQQLQAAGFSQAQADQMAVGQVQAQQQGQVQPTAQDLGFENDEFGDDPYLQEINELRANQAQISQYLAGQQEQQRIASLEAQLNNAVAYVQSQNPDFTDADMKQIVDMAYAYNGDIAYAADRYKTVRDQAVEAWINRKESVTAPGAISAGGSAQQAPEKFTGLDDPRLEAAAIRRLNEALGG